MLATPASATYNYSTHYNYHYKHAKHKRGAITGRVFFDANENGLRDRRESAVSGVTVSLLDEHGNTLISTKTRRNGVYIFKRLPLYKTYFVHWELPDGKHFTKADVKVNRWSYKFDSDADEHTGKSKPKYLHKRYRYVRYLDAGLIKKAPPPPANDLQICGRTWVDTDGNGIQMGGEFGDDTNLGGIPVSLITLIGPGGTEVVTSNDSNGNFFFEDLAPGKYQLMFPEVEGYEFTQSLGTTWTGGQRISVVNLQTGKTIEFHLPEDGNTNDDDPCTLRNIDAGYVPIEEPLEPTIAEDDSIEGEVGETLTVAVLANDTAAEGQVDSLTVDNSDVPGNVQVNQSNEIVISDTTSAGDFTVDYTLTSVNGTSDSASIAVTLTDPVPVDTYEICGRAAIDINENNVQDAGDMILNGIPVSLLASDGSVLQGPVSTAPGGRYEFTGLPAGAYRVQFGLIATAPDGSTRTFQQFAIANQGPNPQFDSDADSDADGSGRTAIINLPADANNGDRGGVVCTVNWIDGVVQKEQ
jgi:hypothetical protein